MTARASLDLRSLRRELAERARALGFDALGVAGIDIPEDERHLIRWLGEGLHGEMHYMKRHGLMRSRPQQLFPGTVRVLSARKTRTVPGKSCCGRLRIRPWRFM